FRYGHEVGAPSVVGVLAGAATLRRGGFADDQGAKGLGDVQETAAPDAVRGDQKAGHAGVVVSGGALGRPPVAAVVGPGDVGHAHMVAGPSFDGPLNFPGQVLG